MGIRASLSFRYIAPTTRTAKSSILTPKIAKIPFAETGWLETAPSATQSGTLWPCRDGRDFPRGWRGFAGVGVTRDALKGLNRPHFRYWSLISIFECHVCAKGGSGPLTGPCSGGKEATREAQNRGRATADGEPISEMADAGIVLLRPFLRRVDLFTGTKRRIERHRDRL